MTGPRVQVRSLRQLRWLARGRVIALAATVGILSLAGLRTVVAGPMAVTEPAHGRGGHGLAETAFAESFSRTYLTWDAERPESRERALAQAMSTSVDVGAGVELGERSRQDVLWTAAVSDRRAGRGRRLVTVAAGTTGGLLYLSVPVARDERGFLFVPSYPALVGPPPTAPQAPVVEEPDVEDSELRVVAERATRNYLARQISDLRADLAPDAVVSLPPRALHVEDVDAVRDLPGARVAVELRATGAGVSWRLRYELAVVRRERWYVRSIQSTSEGRHR